VDGLEKQVEGRAGVARIDVFSDEGSAFAERYRVFATPTYLVVDSRGAVLYRQVGGMPKTEEILARLNPGAAPGR